MNKEEASKLFKALGDSTRLKIVKVLYDTDEICACNFLEYVDCGQPTLSHHLAMLLIENLVSQRRNGKQILYSCNKELVDSLMKFFLTPCSCTEKGEK